MYVIFSDVDGTIYQYGPKTLETRTVEDIKIAQAHGVEFVLITGNAHLSVIKWVARKLDVRYVITSSGNVIYDFKTKQFIRNFTFEHQVAKYVLATVKKFGGHNLTWNNRQIFIDKNAPKFLEQIIRKTIATREKLAIIDDDYNNLSWLNKIIVFGKPAIITQLMQKFQTDQLNVLQLRPDALEVLPAQVSKGEAVQFMINYLNTDYSKVMTVGDGKVDEPMLSLPVFSYALANAEQSTKDVAKYNSASVEQNGLGMAVIDFLYRQKIY